MFGSADNNSRETALKISLASSGLKPYLMGMEYINLLYFSIRASHASSLPFEHSRTRRVSVQPNSAQRGATLRSANCRPALATLMGIQIFHVPQSVRIKNCRVEISDAIAGGYENVGARKTNYRQGVCHNFLDTIV